jgi:hypothetical protein
VVWVCGNKGAPAGNMTDSSGGAATTIDEKYLPSNCRL